MSPGDGGVGRSKRRTGLKSPRALQTPRKLWLPPGSTRRPSGPEKLHWKSRDHHRHHLLPGPQCSALPAAPAPTLALATQPRSSTTCQRRDGSTNTSNGSNTTSNGSTNTSNGSTNATDGSGAVPQLRGTSSLGMVASPGVGLREGIGSVPAAPSEARSAPACPRCRRAAQVSPGQDCIAGKGCPSPG